MKAIYKRELSAYFNNMIGPVVIAFMLAVVGIYFMSYNLFSGYPSFAIALSSALFLFLVTIPVLTMRSMAEDRKTRTDQLLLTAPVSTTSVVLGKFWAMLTVFAVPTALFCLCPLIMKLASGSSGVVYFKTDYASILCFFLLGALYISIGLLISSLTESQLLAMLGTFGVLLVLYLWEGFLQFMPDGAGGNLIMLIVLSLLISMLLESLSGSPVVSGVFAVVCIAAAVIIYFTKSSLLTGLCSKVLGYFTLSQVINNFATNQVFDLSGLLLYVSMTALALFLTVQVIQRRRYA